MRRFTWPIFPVQGYLATYLGAALFAILLLRGHTLARRWRWPLLAMQILVSAALVIVALCFLKMSPLEPCHQ